MSEYQFCEFVALDRPLTPKQVSELRAVSTRAEITATRFWNEYQWGNLKADPASLVERYFDAHLYFANWGTRRCMLRVPANRVDVPRLRAYFGKSSLRVTSKHVVVDLSSDTDDPEDFEVAPATLATFAPLRGDLMRGDFRVAYLAWLVAVQNGELRDREREPPVPAGLANLGASLQALVEFLRIDGDLLAAAAEESGESGGDLDGLRGWFGRLSQKAKDQWLLRALDDPDLALGTEIRRAFRATRRRSVGATRTVGELRAEPNDTRSRVKRPNWNALANRSSPRKPPERSGSPLLHGAPTALGKSSSISSRPARTTKR